MSASKPGPAVHLNLNVRGLPLSATLAINEHSEALRRQGRRVYKLGLGQSPFPVPEPVVEALRENAHQKDYLPVRGLPALREAVAAYHHRADGLPWDADDILIGPGSKELMFLLQLVYYGNLVIPTPSWVSYAPQARIAGRHVRWLPTRAEDGWRLTPDQLERLGREDPDHPRLIILNYPSNPTGQTFTEEQLRALAEVARKYRMILLSDEIYGELHHAGDHVSIARFYPEGTIVSAGLSKWCGAGGWRLGTFAFPRSLRWLLDAMSSAASETYTSTSAPVQFAAIRAFEGGPEIDAYRRHSRRILSALGRYIAERLREAYVSVHLPQGAFYLFPDFSPLREKLRARGIETSIDFCERLLEETNVAMLPGVSFGCRPELLTARLAYVNFDGEKALEAAAASEDPLDASFVETHCAPVVEAIERLCEWLHE